MLSNEWRGKGGMFMSNGDFFLKNLTLKKGINERKRLGSSGLSDY